MLPFCVFICISATTSAADRPAPRKPFVSKSSTGGSTPKPFAISSPSSTAPASSNSAGQVNMSGQAQILTITRSHKPPTVRADVTGQNTTAATPETDTSVSSTAGTQAQIGKIIERQ